MASKLLLIVLLVLVSVSLTSGYSLRTRDAVLKQEDESYLMATSDQGTLMVAVEDVAKARSLQALVTGPKVANKKRASTKSSKKKKHKSKKSKNVFGQRKRKKKSKNAAVVLILISVVVVTFVIICVIYFFYLRHKKRNTQSIEQGKINHV